MKDPIKILVQQNMLISISQYYVALNDETKYLTLKDIFKN